jgi:hypothetical protein
MKDRGYRGSAKDPSAPRAFLGCAAFALVPLALGIAGVFVLANVLPHGACGCASTPDPNWTPPPVSSQQAVNAAAKFAAGGAAAQPIGLDTWLFDLDRDQAAYLVSSPTVDAVVDGRSAMVLEYVSVEAMPDTDIATVSSDAAITTAETFLADRGVGTAGMTVAVERHAAGGTSAYFVTWAGTGKDAAGVSVLVNPSSGAAFAFVDQRSGVHMVAPTIGATAAAKLAQGAVTTPGLVVESSNLLVAPDGSSWDIQLTAPPDHFTDVSVDAVTGAVRVGKST